MADRSADRGKAVLDRGIVDIRPESAATHDNTPRFSVDGDSVQVREVNNETLGGGCA